MREYDTQLLQFLGEEGYSHVNLLGLWIQKHPTTVRRYLNRLEEQGYVQPRILPSLLQRDLWQLTRHGRLLLCEQSPSYTGPTSVLASLHHLTLQEIRIKARNLGYTSWLGERSCRRLAQEADPTWPKVPDALCTTPQGLRLALELELNRKPVWRYQEAIDHYAYLLHEQDIDEVHYLVPPNLLRSLYRLFETIDSIHLFGQTWPLPDVLRQHIRVMNLNTWPHAPRPE
ncbi:MAG: hypothetical protein HKM02_12465 [Pseudomonadales bacterium]|nr:hypothetical protein [Pseudomonadales bacterium]